MKAVKETTKWEFPNHTYLLNGTRVIAYIKDGETQPIKINGKKGIGMPFDKKGRTFKDVSITLFKSVR